jgi:hypothetical protein
MQYQNSMLELIGNTPLLKLNKVAKSKRKLQRSDGFVDGRGSRERTYLEP